MNLFQSLTSNLWTRPLILLGFAIALLSGCGGGGGGGGGATLQSIAVTPANPSILAGLTSQFTATGTYSDGTSQNITSSATWSSGTTSVATVVASGLVSGAGTGSSVITATLGSISGSTTLTIIAATLTNDISGTVTGAANVTINLTGAASSNTTTDPNGDYSFTGLASGSYTVTPSLSGFVFTPANIAVNLGGANVTGKNFAATASTATTYCLSGTVTGVVVQNVTITLGGDNTGSTVTDASGNYSFCGLASGNYTVTPSLAGYTLSPINLGVTISGANATGNNLTTTTSTATTYKPGTSCPADSNFQYSQWIANGSACSYQSATCYFNTPGVGSDASGFWHTRDATGNTTGIFDCKLNGGMSSYQISVGSCSLLYSAQVRSFIDSCNLATFALTTSVVGSGTVSANPPGPNYPSGTVVTLTAAPNAGSTFSGWSGACAGTGSCVVTMDAAKAVTATFNTALNFILTVTMSGTGSGTVTSSPTGVNCGATCSASFATNSSVTLTATPATGSTFTGWSGACAGTGSCVVDMNTNQMVTATFAVSSTQVFAGTFSGSGPITNTSDGCVFQVSLSGDTTATLSQVSGAIDGTALVSGSWSNSVTSGYCIPGGNSFSFTVPVSGTASNVTFSGGSFPAISFTGTLSGSTISGTATFTFTNTTGSISSAVTLNQQP